MTGRRLIKATWDQKISKHGHDAAREEVAQVVSLASMSNINLCIINLTEFPNGD